MSSPQGWFARGAAALGPGLLFVLGAVGPRDLVSNSIAGATYGFSLIWLLVVVLAARFVFLDASGRYVLVTGESLLAGCGRTGRWVTWLMFVVLLIRVHMSRLIEVVLLGAALHAMAPLPVASSRVIWSLVCWGGGFALMHWGRYRVVQKVGRPLAVVMGASLAAAAVLSRPDLTSVVRGALTPSVPAEEGTYATVLVLMGVIAAAAGSISNLQYPTFVHEEGWRSTSFLRRQRFDLVLSLCAMFVMLACIQVAAGSTLKPLGANVEQVEDLIPIFGQVFGAAGRIVLALSMWSVVFTSYLSGGVGYSLMLADIWHRQIRPSEAIGRQDHGPGASYLPAYRWLLAYGVCLPLYVFFTDWTPVGLVLVTSALEVVLLPAIVLIVIRLTADKRIMGAYANGWVTNLVMVLTAAGSVYLAFQTIRALWPH